MDQNHDRREPLEIESFLDQSPGGDGSDIHRPVPFPVSPGATPAQPERRPRPMDPALVQRRRWKRAIILFALTCISTFLCGFTSGAGIPLPPENWWREHPLPLGLFQLPVWFRSLPWEIQHVWLTNGLKYAGSLMLILLFHEMGHFLQAVRYRIPASPPFFIPFPFSPFGTMGAVIIQGAGYADRKSLFDIAISGPLAGLLIALPVAWLGVQSSEVVLTPVGASGLNYGEPLILQWMIRAVHGELAANQTVLLNPLLFAGWVGIFITALNLIPIGQLDGGHILYSLIGRRAHVVATLMIWSAVGFMIYTRDASYSLMVVLLMMMGPWHPPTANDYVELGRFRVLLGWLTLGFIVIGFTPVPLQVH